MALGTAYVYQPDLRLVDVAEEPSPIYSAKVALERGWITDRDLHLVRELATSRFLTRGQVRYLCFPEMATDNAVRRRLQALCRHRLIRQVQWIAPGNPERSQYAYTVTLNGANLARDYFGLAPAWRVGDSRKALRPILQTLAANEFRVQVVKEQHDLLLDWRFGHRTGEPVASFTIGGQLFLIDLPRDAEDALLIRPERYGKWQERRPMILTIAADEHLAAEIFERLAPSIPTDRLLFSTDARAFECALDEPGCLWQWRQDGGMQALALLERAEVVNT